jgi:hypothetical protein
MVYDEGFEIKHGNLELFTFSYYEPDQKNAGSFISDCSQTTVGWYTDLSSKKKGCYKAIKQGEVQHLIS